MTVGMKAGDDGGDDGGMTAGMTSNVELAVTGKPRKPSWPPSGLATAAL